MELKNCLISTLILSGACLSINNAAATTVIDMSTTGGSSYAVELGSASYKDSGYEADDEETNSQKSTADYDDQSYYSDSKETPEPKEEDTNSAGYFMDKALDRAEWFETALNKRKLGRKKIVRTKKTLAKARSNKARREIRKRLAESDKRDLRKETSRSKKAEARDKKY
ncbi:MAG: hypothetical protein H6492_02050 [Candidatus Paracaedibacteraceae bacterium]|nr:hypothetical protein [Candidatus Paracaedibacteraceae bacterium]